MTIKPPRVPFWVIASLYFSALSLTLFGDAFLGGSRSVPGRAGMDLFSYFYPIRLFAIEQVKSGNFPLWNPYVLGGIPALGNFQYALLYPPNWLHLLLPMNLTINLLIAFHVALAGFFTALWCRRRGSSVEASLLGGTIFMFSGPCLLHVSLGYLTYICVIAWIPLLFICIDQIIESDGNRRKAYVLLGAVSVAMQLLGGYPQPAYYAAITAGCYTAVRLINHPRWVSTVVAFVAVYVIGTLLSAAQLLPGLDAVSESVRSGPADYAFATACSLAPENVLLIFSSSLFGDSISAPDMARWGSTNTSMFIGAVATALAIIGATTRSPRSNVAILIAILCGLFFASGSYNPLYRHLIVILPGLGNMRYPARFVVMISLLAAPLAAAGYDHIRQNPQLRRPAFIAIALSILFILFSISVAPSIETGSQGLWGTYLSWTKATGETWNKLDSRNAEQQIRASARMAVEQSNLIAAMLTTVVLILFWSRRRPSISRLILPLALLELFIGSIPAWDRAEPRVSLPAQWRSELAAMAPDDRLLIWLPQSQNLTIPAKIEAVNGYDPSALSRWDNVLLPLLGAEARSGNLEAKRVLPSNRWPMLRFAKILPRNDGVVIKPPMGRLNLLSRYVVASDATESLLAVRRPNFDPREFVVLEQEPSIKPQADPTVTPPGQVELIDKTTDTLEIKADLQRPAILLITDAYSRGWQARPLGASPQKSYEVLPADHALRAVPLAAGVHHFMLEYRPSSVPIGLAVSGITSLAWLGLAAWFSRSARGAAFARSFPGDCPSPDA